MRFKKTLLVTLLLLAILTMGAVSATEELDNLTVDDSIEENIQLESDEFDTLMQASEENELAEPVGPDYYIYSPPYEIYGDDDEPAKVGVYIQNDDATGNVTISINDQPPIYDEKVLPSYYDESEWAYVGGNVFYLKDLEFQEGKNKITFTYTGDDNYNGFSTDYTFYYYDYYFRVGQGYNEEIYFNTDVTFYISLKSTVTNPVTVKQGNRTFTVLPDYGECLITLTDFDLGENEIIFSYQDDARPLRNITKIIYAKPIIEVPGVIEYGIPAEIIVEMPRDAAGNLRIYQKLYNESSGKYEWFLNATVPFNDGVAAYELNWTLGYYEVKLSYDGEDYKGFISENDEYNVNVVPGLVLPSKIHHEKQGEITIIMPENSNEALYVNIYGLYDYATDEYAYNEIVYNKPANGTVTIPINDLALGQYYVSLDYGVYSNYGEFKITDAESSFNLNATFPKTIYRNHYTEFTANVPTDAIGTLTLFVNGEKYEEWNKFYYAYSVHTENFDKMNTWELKFTGDDYYNSSSQSGTFEFKWAYVPEKITFSYDVDAIELYFDGMRGFMVFSIDDNQAFNGYFDSLNFISIKNLKTGNHTYEIIVYDDSNQVLFKENGTFLLDYMFYTNIWDEYPLSQQIIITIKLPEDATGSMIVNYKGKNQTFEVNNGEATIILTDLEMGSEDITITYTGDAKYYQKILKEVINITYYSIRSYPTEDGAVISLELPKNATGNLSVYSMQWGGDSQKQTLLYSGKLIDGKASYELSGIGNYIIHAKYDGEDYAVGPYYTVYNLVPDVEYSEEIILGENATFIISAKNANEDFIIRLDGQIIFEDKLDENGMINITINGLDKLGSHYITITYNGTVLHDSDEFTIGYYYYIIPGEINVPVQSKPDKPINITLELSEFASGNVTVLNGDEILVQNISVSGISTITLPSLKTGNYWLDITYFDDNYGEYWIGESITVTKPDAGENVVIPKEITSDNFNITLPENAIGLITVTIDGKTQTIPLVNGTANVNLSDTPSGQHNITVTYSGDKNYDGFEKTGTLSIPSKQDGDSNSSDVTPSKNETAPAVPVKITAKDMSMYYNDGTKYSVTVYGTNGKPAAGIVVTFLIDGKKLGTAKTDAKGVATIKIAKTPKSYKITSQALGAKVTKKLTVKQVLKLKKVKVKKSAKKLVLQATLKQGKKALKGKKITFKFNGKKITVKTNKKGVAKVTIKKKVLKKLKKGKKVKYSATYLKDTVKKTVKVKK